MLPLARTSSPVDSDIVQDISQTPIRERFALIIDELGTGLAARGSDLNDVIHRANPALGQTDKVLQILASQNRTLARLATESDAVLAPLAKAKAQLSDFVRQANTTSVASAARAADISRSFQLFPQFLQQLRPLVADLGKFADQGTPLMASLATSAASVSRQFQNLAPFARAARPALIELGNSSQQSQQPLLNTIPLARRLNSLGTQAVPTAKNLDRLTSSLDNTGGIEFLMSLLYNGTSGHERVRPRRAHRAEQARGRLLRLVREDADVRLRGDVQRRRRGRRHRRRQPGHAQAGRDPGREDRVDRDARSMKPLIKGTKSVKGTARLPDREPRVRRRTPREQSVLSNPILIGALTVLATIAAVTLAYQANNGLPFVPKYHLNVQIRNASELTHGAEVHMGGALIGNVTHDHRGARPEGPADRAAQAEPQQDRAAVAGQFDVQRPTEGRDRAQVPGGRPRRLGANMAERRDRSGQPDERRGRP